MAKHKLTQVPLVSADGRTQPPFPGGWVLALIKAVHEFAPEWTSKCQPRSAPRTLDRIKKGESVKQTTYDELETQLIRLVSAIFPKVSVINDFAKKYVNEYFRLWKEASVIAPYWAQSFGFEPGPSSVLTHALFRDLVLRLCYLESCERSLTSSEFDPDELALLRFELPEKVYQHLIKKMKSDKGLSHEKLARKLNLSGDKILYRVEKGEALPNWPLLKALQGERPPYRLLAGIGFFDVVARRVGLHHKSVTIESMKAAEIFLPHHWRMLTKMDFRTEAQQADNLLLHPGFNGVWPRRLPNAIWRAHLYTLQYARMPDMAQAYIQFASSENERELEGFLKLAESESNDSPHHWMERLRKLNPIIPMFNPEK
jgi:DNA-binding XRE family transcriptional regulator